jgi:hypothetical protein
MKRVSMFVLAAVLGFAPISHANSEHDTSGDVTVSAQGGAGGHASAESTAVGVGGNASNRTEVDVHNTANQFQEQGQDQGQNQGIDAFNNNKTVVNPDVHVKYDGRTHAESAPESRGMTTGSDTTVCGAVGGASAQTGVFGGGISSESFACLATKHSVYQAAGHSKFDSVVENVAWYFPPFLVLRMVRSAIFN